MRKIIVGLLTALVGMIALPTTASAASESACISTWGSGSKYSNSEEPNPRPTTNLTDVRSGQHQCFDRLVLDAPPAASSFSVNYVDEVEGIGSGEVVPLRGGARLVIDVGAPAYDDGGRATYSPASPDELVNVSNYATFRQVAFAGSFEGKSRIGLGVRARLPYRVMALDDGRLVIDVAHRWS